MDAIWLFAGGALQKTAAKKVIERGYKLILTDKDEHCLCSELADEFIRLDTFDIEANLKIAQSLKSKYRIKAVLTVAADCHETVANVAKLLNLPGVEPRLSNICRFKLKTREILSKAGIPQPQFVKVKSRNEALSAARNMGLPVVLKATDNSGSRGFAKIEHIEDITDSVFEAAVKAGTTGRAVMEKLITPSQGLIAEQSVETLWYGGKMYWLNWVDRLFRQDFLLFDSLKTGVYSNQQWPWGVELGHINPAIHEEYIRKQVCELIYKAGLAIGMDRQKGSHILKADIILTPQGPYILELTPRLSGGWDSSKSTPARGADFIGGAISLALGEKLDLDLWFNYFQYKNPNLFSAVLALIDPDARDCIGRKFAEGSGFERINAVIKAYNNLMEAEYVV